MSKLIRELEQKIVRKVIKDALAAGYSITVYDGEQETLKRSTDAKVIFNAMFTTDADTLYLHLRTGAGTKEIHGWIDFVYGNDGHDVIHDYTTNLEQLLIDANKLADKYAA